MATVSDIVRVAHEIHWFNHRTNEQVKNWTMAIEGIEYVYEYRTNILTNQTWVFRKYKVSEITDLEIKRCLNSIKIATESMPKDKAITKLKTVVDLYEGKFKW